MVALPGAQEEEAKVKENKMSPCPSFPWVSLSLTLCENEGAERWPKKGDLMKE